MPGERVLCWECVGKAFRLFLFRGNKATSIHRTLRELPAPVFCEIASVIRRLAE